MVPAPCGHLAPKVIHYPCPSSPIRYIHFRAAEKRNIHVHESLCEHQRSKGLSYIESTQRVFRISCRAVVLCNCYFRTEWRNTFGASSKTYHGLEALGHFGCRASAWQLSFTYRMNNVRGVIGQERLSFLINGMTVGSALRRLVPTWTLLLSKRHGDAEQMSHLMPISLHI